MANNNNIVKIDESLRPYQQQSKEKIFTAWESDNSVLFQMPTGTGKTRLFTSIIHDINNYSIKKRKAVKILIIAHRTELIDQIHNSLDKYKIAHGLIIGSSKREFNKPVQVASIQTFSNSNNLDAQSIKFDYIIIDEAHHAQAASYKKLWDLYPEAKFLGVTATPWRMNNSGFKDLFNTLIISDSVKDFIKNKYLSKYKYLSIKEKSAIVKKIADIKDFDIDGDYKISSVSSILDQQQIRAQLYKSYEKYAKGLKGIIYAINKEHSIHICQEYKTHDVNIVQIDSSTPKKEREEIVNDFKSGKIEIIVNVDIFSEGFDCPDIDFVQMARPTKSLAKYLQQVGRALRVAENKSEAIILDNVGMYFNFGLPDIYREWEKYFIGVPKGTRGQKGQVYEITKSRFISYEEGKEQMVVIKDNEEKILEKERKRPLFKEKKGVLYLNDNYYGGYFDQVECDNLIYDRYYSKKSEEIRKSELKRSETVPYFIMSEDVEYYRGFQGGRPLTICRLADEYNYILLNGYPRIIMFRSIGKIKCKNGIFYELLITDEVISISRLFTSELNMISKKPMPFKKEFLFDIPSDTELFKSIKEWEKEKIDYYYIQHFNFNNNNYYWFHLGDKILSFDNNFKLIEKVKYSEYLINFITKKNIENYLPGNKKYIICNANWMSLYFNIVDRTTTNRVVFYKTSSVLTKPIIFHKINDKKYEFICDNNYDTNVGYLEILDENIIHVYDGKENDRIIDLSNMKILKK